MGDGWARSLPQAQYFRGKGWSVVLGEHSVLVTPPAPNQALRAMSHTEFQGFAKENGFKTVALKEEKVEE